MICWNKQDDKYIYDLIGNIFNINIRTTACGVGGTNGLDRVFDYDPLNRVISGTGRENVSGGNYPFPGWDDTVRSSDANTTQAYTRKYTYDKVGNIQQVKQLSTGGFTRDFNYTPNQNKLEEIEVGLNSYNFTYDNVGNQLTENTTRKFEWDAGNRLLLFKNQVGSAEPSVIAQYLYDSSGNRVKKIVRKQGRSYEIRTYIDGVFEHYTDEVTEQNTIHIMDASSGSAQASRVASVRIGDAMGDTTPAIKYNLENNIYSSMVVLDNNGTIVNTQEYYPFGETSFGSYGKKRYQYVGKERDEESGLYYYGARYFSPWIARFISCDPLAAKYAQLSPYNYSDNNPINDFDIDGLQDNNTVQSPQGDNSPPPDFPKNPNEFDSVTGVNGNEWLYSKGKWRDIGVPVDVIGTKSDNLSGQPSALESIIPVWGSAKAAVDDFRNGKWGWGIFNTVMAVSDVFLLKSIATAAVKGAILITSKKVVAKEGAEITAKTSTSVLSKGELLRIENAATRINKPITVVGSRAKGTAGAYSDWDYVIPGLNSKNRSAIKNSLPGARSVLDNTPRNIDIFKGPVNTNLPHITVYPR